MMTVVALGIVALWMLGIAIIIAVPIALLRWLTGSKGSSTPEMKDLKGEMVRAQYEYDRTLRRRD